MSNSMEEAKLEIAATRAQLSDTADELGQALQEKVTRAKQAVNPLHYAREYPWVVLGLALGAGLAIGMSGADKKAASAVVEGARKAGEAIGEGASNAKDAIVEKFHGSDDSSDMPATADTDEQEDSGIGVRERIAMALDDLLHDGLHDILGRLNSPSSSRQSPSAPLTPSLHEPHLTPSSDARV